MTLPPHVSAQSGRAPHSRPELAAAPLAEVPDRSWAALADLADIAADLSEVAVWTSPDGHGQEHASFLLRDTRGRWRSVGFSEPVAGDLVARLRALPAFDTDALRDLVLLGVRGRRIVPLWCAR
ncbi:MAG TPA: hypothetical protein VGH99_17225 [Pseudonocardia sp.]|jgi:hypothetical protein